MTPENGIVIYEGGEARVEVRVERESVWLSLQQLAEVFERDKSVISRHLKASFTSGELERDSVVAKMQQLPPTARCGGSPRRCASSRPRPPACADASAGRRSWMPRLPRNSRSLGIAGEWREVCFSELCDIMRGASPRTIHEWIAEVGVSGVRMSDANASKSRFITSTNERIKSESRHHSVEVHPGDLILSNSATPGIPKFMGIDACIHA